MRELIFYGKRGLEVQQAQRLLGITPDGIFGPAMQAAVVAFQRQQGLSPDGIVGPDTWAALEGGLPETLTVASWGASRAPFVLRLPPGWQVTSGYGLRGNPPQEHHGIDLAGAGWAQSPPLLLAPCTGRVVEANTRDPWGGGYGYWLLLVAAENPELAFFAAHLSQVVLDLLNSPVQEGQPLGRMGNTGRSYGVHLHAEIRHQRHHTDPATWMRVEDCLHGQERAA
jgi:murein DD-endopeptidase MepM/ murein hydrolase activator NlpD